MLLLDLWFDKRGEIGTIITAVTAAAAVAGTTTSIVQSGRASRASERAEDARRRQILLRERRERARQIREQQLLSARIRGASIAGGIQPGSSTSVETGLTDSASELNRNLSFLRTDTGLSLGGSRALSDAERARSSASTGESVARLGFGLFDRRDQIQRLFARTG